MTQVEHLMKEHSAVRMLPNIVGAYSPIFVVSIPTGTVYTLVNDTEMRAKLRDAANAELPHDATMLFAWTGPDKDIPVQIGAPIPYRAFRSITEEAQMNVDTRAMRLIKVPEGELGFPHDYQLIVQLRSSVALAVANSHILFEVEKTVR
ncbi:MAG: hypothetical protein DDT31_01611 [Syntrophomonadaceae bacterium]|nr:hypothetical protein [Bacillota bacterium]